MTRLCLLMALALTTVALGACSPNAPTVPCPLCYEDEWSKEPFPGQEKQHTKALTPDELQANGLDAARQLIGTPAATQIPATDTSATTPSSNDQ